MMIQRIETTDGQGNIVEVREVEVPDPPADPTATILAAVQTARSEVAGFAPSNGTRQAVEALATAVEALI